MLLLEDDSGRIQLNLSSFAKGDQSSGWESIGAAGLGKPLVPDRQDGIQVGTGDLVTGMVVAVLGRENTDGEFDVEDGGICFAGMPKQVPLASVIKSQQQLASPSNRRLVALVSDIGIGANYDPLAVTMLFDYLQGHLGSLVVCISLSLSLAAATNACAPSSG
jgi:hypothetical protein